MKTIFTLFVCVLFLFTTGNSFSAAKNKSYGENVLRPVDLKACVAMEKKLDTVVSKTKHLRIKIDKNKDIANRMKSEIIDMEKGVDTESKEDVKAFNNKVRQYNNLREKYLTQIKSYNSLVDRHTGLYKKHKQACAGKQYYSDDKKNL